MARRMVAWWAAPLLLWGSAPGCGPQVGTPGDEESSGAMTSDGSTPDDDPPPDEGSASGFADGPMPPAGPTLEGEYLLALGVVLDPAHPLQWHVDVTTADDGVQRALQLQLQALSVEVGATVPGPPVGAPTMVSAELDDAGGFLLSLPQLVVQPTANPISGGQIAADVVLQGHIVDETLGCGTVEGTIVAPLMLDLAGSTFALRRIDGGMLPPLQSACP